MIRKINLLGSICSLLLTASLTQAADLLLFVDEGANHTFLGCFSCSPYDNNSIWNEYGPYGSEYSGKSIWND